MRHRVHMPNLLHAVDVVDHVLELLGTVLNLIQALNCANAPGVVD
jgi:hypothetical protein